MRRDIAEELLYRLMSDDMMTESEKELSDMRKEFKDLQQEYKWHLESHCCHRK